MKHVKLILAIALFIISGNTYGQTKADYPNPILLKVLLNQVIGQLDKGFTSWRGKEISTTNGKQYATYFKLTTGDEPKLFLENGTWYYTDVLLSEATSSSAAEVQSDWQNLIAESNPSWTVREKKDYNNISITGFTSTDDKPAAVRIIAYPLNDKWQVSLVAAFATTNDETVVSLVAMPVK